MRCDGRMPMKQMALLGTLAGTGSALAAARLVGMAREIAYRLHRNVARSTEGTGTARTP